MKIIINPIIIEAIIIVKQNVKQLLFKSSFVNDDAMVILFICLFLYLIDSNLQWSGGLIDRKTAFSKNKIKTTKTT